MAVWKVVKTQRANGVLLEILTQSGRIICRFGENPTAEDFTNARFIAAVPKLVIALQEMMREFEPPSAIADISDAIILSREVLAELDI